MFYLYSHAMKPPNPFFCDSPYLQYDIAKLSTYSFHTFKTETEPVVSRLKSSKRCPVVRIDGDRSIEEVWADTRAVIDRIVISDVLAANAAVVEVETGDKRGEGGGRYKDAEVRLLEGGDRATVTCMRVDDTVVGGMVEETKEWAFDGNEGGWISVGVESVPLQ